MILTPREPFKRDTVDLAPGAIEEVGGVLVSRSPTLSSAHVSHTMGGIRHTDDFPHWPQKKDIMILPEPWEPFKRDTVDRQLGQLKESTGL